MHSVRFTPTARAELDAIVAYTVSRHGKKQADIYREGFRKTFHILSENPKMGSDQSVIRPGLRRLVHQAHTIYYRIEDDYIIVARILGPGQDPLEEL